MTALQRRGEAGGDAFKKIEPMITNVEEQSSLHSYSERKFFAYRNLQFEIVRRATFKDWPLNFLTPEDLAKNGFFYLHRDDDVQCIFCKGVIAHWEPSDVPRIEHAKHYPSCPLVLGSCVSNVPHDGTKTNAMLENYIISRLDGDHPPERKARYQTDSITIRSFAVPDRRSLQFPDYDDRNKRLLSFVNSAPNMPDSEKMVDAGFFCVGLSDMTHCFECGGGIFNWSKEEDPLALHQKMYPLCPYANKDLRNQEDATSQSNNSSKRKRPMLPQEKEELINFPIAKKMAKMGYPAPFITEALGHQLEIYGILPITVDDGTDAMLDFEEYLENKEIC